MPFHIIDEPVYLLMSIVESRQLRRFILLDIYISALSGLNDSNWICTEYSTLLYEYFDLQTLLQCTVNVIINET